MSRNTNVLSLSVVVLLSGIVLAIRTMTLGDNELSWDVFGYYLYLPAAFIHHDPLLHDTRWIHQVMQQREISGTLYQLSSAPDGGPIYFFLMGMAIMYLPFFLGAHAIAGSMGLPQDGFSLPYQYGVALGSVLYTIIGLIFLRKILLKFFDDRLAAVVLVIVVLGTNYLHFMTVKNLETANFLFCWMSVLVWCTLRWHEDHRRKHILGIAVAAAFMTLIKPSEVICLLIPLLWGVHGRSSWRARRTVLRKHAGDVRIAVLLGMLIVLPQMIYWTITTGRPVYDSYKNPGVGLDLWAPHIGNALFSFRKGWLIYTPVMTLAIVGFYFLRKRHRELFPGILTYCLVAFWIISSWTEWWYGASYSIRPMITSYILLSIPLGCTLERIGAVKSVPRIAALSLVASLVALNLFQTWQFNRWILDPYRTTRAYYLAVFGRTNVPEGAPGSLLMERAFDGSERMGDPARYDRRILGTYSFEEVNDELRGHVVGDTAAHSMVLCMDGEMKYSPSVEMAFEKITSGDHFWAQAQARVLITREYSGEPPCLVMTMQRWWGSYGYRTVCTPNSLERGVWATLQGEYLTPPIRNVGDRFKVYIWRRGEGAIFIDDLQVEVFDPR